MIRYIKKITPYLLAEIAFDILCTILIAFGPVLQKWLFDYGLPGGAGVLAKLVLLYALMQILYTVCTYFCMLFTWKGAIRFELLLKRGFFRSVFQMRANDFYKRDVGEYISLQGNNITALEQDYLQPTVDLVRSANMFVIYGIVLFVWVDWRIALTIALVSLLTVLGPKLTGKKLSEKRNGYFKQAANYVSGITDLLEGFRVINSRTRNRFNGVHEKVLEKTADTRYGYGKAKTASLSVSELALGLIRIASFAAAGFLLLRGEITVGTGVAAFGYVDSFIEPIKSILYDVNALQSIRAVKETFLKDTAPSSAPALKTPSGLQKEISFQNVCCRYQNFSLKNISLRFAKGKRYAVIGHSGSGKSTLLKLLMGYVSPSSGTIAVDGAALDSIDFSGLVSYIDQNEHIFQTGYEDNATVFGSYSTEKLREVLGSLKLPILKPILSKQSGDNCQTLSGGEKQTLAYLRMASKDAPVILMDEPFSAVDSGTRERLTSYLFNSLLSAEQTLIVVTHDLTENLNRFDEILLMKDGAVVRHGPFAEIKGTEEYLTLSEQAKTE